MRRLAVWIAALAVAAAQAWAALSRPASDRLADLDVYVGAIALLRDGGSLYDYVAPDNAAPFTYPPFAAVLFYPLGYVPIDALRVLWTLVIVGATVLLAVLVARHSRYPAALIALVLFASAPVSSNLRFGQVSLLLVLVVLLDCLGVTPAKARGALVGLAGAVKLTPLIFVPYQWISGQRRAAVTAVVTAAAATALGWAVLSGDSVRYWFGELWDVKRVGNIHNTGNQSLNGALLRLDVPDPARSVVMLLLGLAVVAVALIRARRLYADGALLAAAVVVGAAGLVFSPVSWTHHQVWLVLAAALPVGVDERWNRVWSVLVAALMILPVTALGDVATGNSRLWLAIAVAVAVPFTHPGTDGADQTGVDTPTPPRVVAP